MFLRVPPAAAVEEEVRHEIEVVKEVEKEVVNGGGGFNMELFKVISQ